MTINFISLIFICMLPLTVSSQNDNFTTVAAGNFTDDQVTSGVSNITPSITPDISLTMEETMKSSTTPSLSATQTEPSQTQPDIGSAATSAYSTLSQLSSSMVGMKSTTEMKFEVTTSATMVISNQATNPTIPTTVPPMLSSSTQSQETGEMSTALFNNNNTTNSSTSLTQSTYHMSTTTSSTTPVSTNTVTGGDATQSTGLYKTSKTTEKTTHTTKTTKKQDKDQGKKGASKGTNHGKVVAGLIGGALVLMMVGFLVICLRKRKLQKQQITTSEWAGPSPFLEGGSDNGHVALRSSNRISFSGFLPQRLSKRLSLLPETDEEMEEIRPGTTFGSKRQVNSFGQKVDENDENDENDVKESNGTAAPDPEMKSTGDATETETANLTSDVSANPPTPSVENATAQIDDGPGQL